MAAIKSKNTKPELLIRRFLHSLGFRYGLHGSGLPGKPDMVFKQLRTVVLINGCFWHHHGCANSVWPRTRRGFWREKIMGNRQRDRRNQRELQKLGWRVIKVWECEVRNGDAIPLLLDQLSAAAKAWRSNAR
jgi:DNA mismatch endonuclease (patch repair protein)